MEKKNKVRPGDFLNPFSRYRRSASFQWQAAAFFAETSALIAVFGVVPSLLINDHDLAFKLGFASALSFYCAGIIALSRPDKY